MRERGRESERERRRERERERERERATRLISIKVEVCNELGKRGRGEEGKRCVMKRGRGEYIAPVLTEVVKMY